MSNSRKKKKKKPNLLLPMVAILAVAALVLLIAFDPFSRDGGNVDENSNVNGHENGQYTENGEGEMLVPIIFRFPDADGILQEELRQMELRADDDMVRAVITALENGPKSSDLNGVFPDGLTVENHTLVDGTTQLHINFSYEFNNLTHAQRIILTASMVYTLTELDFVDYLIFRAGGLAVLDASGEEFGPRSRTNTVLDINADAPTTTLVLYFMDENWMGLVPETRVITSLGFAADVEAIVRYLLQGPQNSALGAVISENVPFIGVDVIGDMASVDFGSDFLNIFAAGGTFLERMVVYSLVNSLTERPEINRVQILIDGLHLLPDELGIGLHTDFSRPFERNEDVILRGQ